MLFCQGIRLQCKFSITPVAPTLSPQKARLEGLVRHNYKVQECVFSVCNFLPSSETWSSPKEVYLLWGNDAFATLIDAHRPGLYWDAVVAPCRLPQLMESYLHHQNKFLLELLAVILEHRILKSCIFLFTFAHIRWILGLPLSFRSSLPSLSVKAACILFGRKKVIWALIIDSPFAPVFHKGKVACVVFLKSFSTVTSNIQLFEESQCVLLFSLSLLLSFYFVSCLHFTFCMLREEP